MNPFMIGSGVIDAAVIGLMGLGYKAIPKLPFDLREVRRATENGFDELLVTEYLVAYGLTFNEDGALTTGWKLRGHDATTHAEIAMRAVVNDLNSALSCTGVGWMYELQRVRRPVTIEPPSSAYIASPTNAVLREARKLECMVDDLRLLVTYLPPKGTSSKILSMLVSDNRTQAERDVFQEARTALEQGCTMIETTLRSCMVLVERLQGRGQRDELVDTLYCNVNGWSLPGIVLPPIDLDEQGLFITPLPLREVLAVQDFVGGMDVQYGQEHIRCISIVGFPNYRQPRILAELSAMAIPMRDHSRFIVGHPDEMNAELTRRFNDARDEVKPLKLIPDSKSPKDTADAEIAKRSLNKDALTRLDEIQEVSESHRNGTRKHAWYSRIIELRSTDLVELNRWQSAICEALRVAGFGVRVEDYHAVDAFLSTLGGNGYNFVRRTAAHGVMFGDLANLTDSWPGRTTITCDKCPSGTVPMIQARRADTLAPFAVDLHGGSTGDVMATIVQGPIGFGKTTLVNAIIANFCQGSADRVLGFDYMRSQERTAVEISGAYGYPGEVDSPVRLCPFTALDTVGGRARAVEWCELISTKAGRNASELRANFTEAIDFLASSPTWRDEACITLFAQKLSCNRLAKQDFEAYADGGIYGHVFDATPNEMLRWQRQVRIYDTTALHSLGQSATLPALMLLCADAEREMDGRRMLLVIEEAHIPLKDPFLEPWLITLVRTTRKKHLGIVFVLTDMEGIGAGTLRTLRSLCATVFVSENPNAEATRDAYTFLGFTKEQIDALIPSSKPSLRRDGLAPLRFRYWQLGSDGVAPFVLDLSPAELEVYARGNDADKLITAEALRDHPRDTPAAIFDAVGLHDEAVMWRSYAATQVGAAPVQTGMQQRAAKPRLVTRSDNFARV